MPTLPLAALRRHVVAWQGFATRFRRASDNDVAECVRRLSCVQLDSIAAVERSHLLVLGARTGAVDPAAVSRLLASGRLFEYWAHEACLLPVEDWPLLLHRMHERRTHHWWGPVIDSEPALAARILDEVRAAWTARVAALRRARGRRDVAAQARQTDARRVVDGGRTGRARAVKDFSGSIDLPERVLSAAVLAARAPAEKETVPTLVVRAVNARGALTAHGIVEHYRLQGGTARIASHLAALCSRRRD